MKNIQSFKETLVILLQSRWKRISLYWGWRPERRVATTDGLQWSSLLRPTADFDVANLHHYAIGM